MTMEVETINHNPAPTIFSKEDRLTWNIQKCVKNIIEREGYINYSIDKKVFTPNGSGFVGTFCEVDIKGKTNRESKNRHIFLKIIVPDEKMTLLSMPDAYKRELFVYKELSKVFYELQDEVNVPPKERYKFVESYEESNSKVIILDNMNRKGFKTIYRMDVPTFELAKLVIEEIAKFHALSFALEDRRPEYFDKTIKKMGQPFNFDMDWQMYVRNMCRIASRYMEENSKQKLANFKSSIFEKHPKYLQYQQTRRCLCHGDYRAGNVLVKEVNGKPIEVIPIDFQLVFYGCPVLDFIYFIFSASDQKFRRAHLPTLKDIYYDALKHFLQYFDMDVNIIYPRKEFERMFKERLDYGLIISLSLLPFTMAMETDVPDITKAAMSQVKVNTDDRFGGRIVGIINDFIEWGYL